MLSKLKGIALPSEREFVLVDNTLESKLPTQGPVPRIPIIMWIDYGGKMPNPPSVAFLINPATMSSAFTKKVNPSFTRGGFVVEQWGENLDVLNFSGTLGAYYVLASSSVGTGLNRYDRSKSYSFRNLMEVFLIYRNNGAIFANAAKNASNNQNAEQEGKLIESAGYKTVDNRVPNSLKTTKTRIMSLGDVYLQYDRTLYMGTFDSFSIEEDATKPFSLTYNFTFTVLRRSIADNRVASYYKQAALEFEDQTTSRRGTSVFPVVSNYLETKKKSSDQESLTNPNTFNTNISRAAMPSVALAWAVKILGSKGYGTTSSQDASYYNSFMALQNDQTYTESERTKENIHETTRQAVGANTTKAPAEKDSDARDVSDSIISMATSLASQSKK